MAFAEDFTAFFSPDEFADTATLGGAAVVGIFDKVYQTDGAGIGFASSQPAFTLPSGNVAGDPIGQLLVLNAVSYTVVAAEPDGTGVTNLLLELTPGATP